MSGISRGQLLGVDVVQAEFLEAGRVDQRRAARRVDPVPGGAGRGVLARVERLRDLAGQRLRAGTSRLISVLLPAPEGPSTSVVLPASSGASALARRFGPWPSATAAARRMHAPVGREPGPGALDGSTRSLLLRAMRGRDARPRAAISARASWGSLNTGLGRDQDQHLVEVGREGLGADLVLPVEQVAPRLAPARSCLRRSLACQRTRSPTTAWLFLPRGWQMRRSPSGVSTRQWRPWLATTRPARACRRSLADAPPCAQDASSASALAAQSKSVTEMPPRRAC